MRPRSYARKPTDAHTSSRTHLRTYTYIHPCTHTYARIRAREGIFLTTNLLYNIAKPTSIISLTAFTSIIQSPYNPYPYWYHIGCGVCTNYHYLTSIIIYSEPLANHFQLSANRSIISHLYLIHYHCHPSSRTVHPHIIYHLYPITSLTHHPINMSVCYKTLSILYILAALPYTTVFSSFISLYDSLL